MSSVKEYFSQLGSGIVSLLKGMGVTGKEFVKPKITELYPENRLEKHVPQRFRAILQFIYPDPEHYKCVACGICERNCPNGTITIESHMGEDADGRKRKILDHYYYDLGSCTFCQLCVSTCPHDAIEFNNDFEQAMFTRAKLVKQLNKPGTTLLPKPAAAPAAAKPAAAAGAAPAAKPAGAVDPQAAARAKAEALMATDPEKAKKILAALDKAPKAKPTAPAPAAAKPDPQAAARAKAEALMATDPEKAKKILAALDKAAANKPAAEAKDAEATVVDAKDAEATVVDAKAAPAPAAKPDPQAAARAKAEALMATDPEKAKKILAALEQAAKKAGNKE